MPNFGTVRNIDANYVCVANDQVLICDATAGPFQVTLPSANLFGGRIITLVKKDATANDVTLVAPGGWSIDADADTVLSNTDSQIGVVLGNAAVWYGQPEAVDAVLVQNPLTSYQAGALGVESVYGKNNVVVGDGTAPPATVPIATLSPLALNIADVGGVDRVSIAAATGGFAESKIYSQSGTKTARMYVNDTTDYAGFEIDNASYVWYDYATGTATVKAWQGAAGQHEAYLKSTATEGIVETDAPSGNNTFIMADANSSVVNLYHGANGGAGDTWGDMTCSNGSARCEIGDDNGSAAVEMLVNTGAGGFSKVVVTSNSGARIATLIAEDATASVGLQVGGSMVVGPQGAAIADAAGGATVDAEARTAINTLLARLRAHGLIAT